jgi:hypothetical protein
MRPSPKSKHDEIIQELNHISDQIDRRPHIFKLNGFKKDAKRMIQREPDLAYTILGIIACLEDDITLMHKYHKNAIQCSGESAHTLSQYSASLAGQELSEQAYEYACKAYEKARDDKDILVRLMCLAYRLGKDDEYDSFKKKLIKLNFDFQDPAEFMEDSDDFLQNAFDFVDNIIKSNPEMVVEPDPEFEAFVDDLIDGVDI